MKKERFNYRWKKQTKKIKAPSTKRIPKLQRKRKWGNTCNNGGKTMGG